MVKRQLEACSLGRICARVLTCVCVCVCVCVCLLRQVWYPFDDGLTMPPDGMPPPPPPPPPPQADEVRAAPPLPSLSPSHTTLTAALHL